MKKILCIEDEAALQTTLGGALKNAGLKVVSAMDGEEGLAKARTEKPDLILLDLILPKMSGFDVLQAVKNSSETKSIPVIVLTNLEGTGDIDRALSLGATTFLVKANYDVRDIVNKVRQAVGAEA